MRNMKRKTMNKWHNLLYSVVLLVAAPSFTSCEDEEDEATVEVGSEQLVFAKEGGQDSFVIRCGGNWSINVVPPAPTEPETSNDWFTMDALSGSGDCTITVTAQENNTESGSSRRTKVAVVCGAQSDTLIVSQQGVNDGLIILQPSYTVTAEEQILTVQVRATGNFTVRQSSDYWITQTSKPEADTRAYEEKEFYLKIARNYGEERKGSVTLVWAEKYYNVSITQEKGEMPEANIVNGSNCYLLQPGGIADINLDRVSYFWNNAEYGDPSKNIGNATEWEVSLLWQDAKGTIAGFLTDAESVEKTLSGAGINDVTSFKVKAGDVEGNAVVAIRPKGTPDEPGNYLWSWHIWVTAYNPDATTLTPEAGKYFYPVTGGEVHRYGGTEWESGKYANTFMMDRNLGARSAEWNIKGNDINQIPSILSPSEIMQGVLYFQWGRKDPFGDSTTLYDISGNKLAASNPKNVASRQLKGGKISIATGVLNPTSLHINAADTWCTQYTGNIEIIWNSLEIDPDVKSIFDPCPLGWKLPDNDILAEHLIPFNQPNANTSFDEDYTGTGSNRIYYYPSGTPDGGKVFFPTVGVIDPSIAEYGSTAGYMARLFSNKRAERWGEIILEAIDNAITFQPGKKELNTISAIGYASYACSVRCIKETEQ